MLIIKPQAFQIRTTGPDPKAPQSPLAPFSQAEGGGGKGCC